MWRLIFKDFEPSHCKMILLERLWTFPLQDDFVHSSVMLSAVLVYYIGVWFAQPAICIMWFCPCSNSIDLSHIIYIWYVQYLCSIDKQFNIFRQCTYIVNLHNLHWVCWMSIYLKYCYCRNQDNKFLLLLLWNITKWFHL